MRAREFLDKNDVQVTDEANASKDRRGRDEAIALARAADRVLVARGKKVVTFDMKRDPPDDDTLAAHVLGPTGNLRAPTVRRGRTLLVGFSADAYEQFLRG